MAGISTIAKKVYFQVENLLVILINSLPKKLLVRFVSRVRIIGKMDYARCDVFLRLGSEIDYNTRLLSCNKEPETIEWIETFLHPDQVVYDIGANVGAYSLVASKFLKGQVRIYAFEPGFVTYGELCNNILLNDCQDTIFPMQVALSDKTGMDVFNYNNLIPGGALHALGDAIDYKREEFSPVVKQMVLAYKIDDLVGQFELPVPNHIKIDVDGIELKILKGAEATLQNPLVNSIILELSGDAEDTGDITRFLESTGFAVHSKYHNRWTDTCIFERANM